MTADIRFKDSRVPLNNWMFDRLIAFGTEVAKQTARDEEQRFVAHMEELKKGFWPGRGIHIVSDFPDVAERKFWSRVFRYRAGDS